MVIQDKDFRLTLVCGDIFDLELLKTVNKGKGNERQEFKIAAYGVRIETALRYVANARIDEGNSDIIDIKTYLQEYRNIIDELRQICKS